MKGEYSAPAHKSTTIRGAFMSDDSSGVEGGLSKLTAFDSEGNGELNVNQATSKSGNPRQCIGKRTARSVSEKGHSFDVGA